MYFASDIHSSMAAMSRDEVSTISLARASFVGTIHMLNVNVNHVGKHSVATVV